ncbi:Formate dehydrogenase chloroplastic/mitochondrial [Zea mays]|uniref:Formate dehydrogenase chloroplastic/mitochondrial n=1 Tax=Zea mays TaxID=4577 RepID=A0A1D6P089_MAIZE|nr:Formate dehydrogenase chloroplastic/mitochondrial [Zea mays]
MAMWRAAARQLVDRALGSRAAHTSTGSKKIVGVFYKAGEYADKNPNFVGCVEGALGIRGWLESQGHQYIVTDDKEGPNCGEWNVAGIAHRAYDLEGKTVGTVGAGRIGRLLLQRLKPFNCNLLYHDRLQIDPELEKEIGAKFEEDLDAMLPKCDVIVINTPLTEKTRGMFNKERIAKMKKGVIVVNNARGAIMDAQAVADACSSGHIAGYGGDVWFPQPAPKDHPWRYMPNHAMTPHISGTTIDAQLRYADGVRDMLDRYFKGEDFPVQNYIVKEGQLASQYQ